MIGTSLSAESPCLALSYGGWGVFVLGVLLFKSFVSAGATPVSDLGSIGARSAGGEGLVFACTNSVETTAGGLFPNQMSSAISTAAAAQNHRIERLSFIVI